jgi:hypothetical protein
MHSLKFTSFFTHSTTEGKKMIQEDLSQIKFGKLKLWENEIFQLIKKDIKSEYLRQHPEFVLKHFHKRAVDKLTAEEIVKACVRELADGNEAFAEWAIARWVMKNGEIYQYFATELTKINPKFDEITSIADDVAALLLKVAIAQFGAKRTYLFSVMNSVSFSPSTFESLKSAAEQEPVAVVEDVAELSVDAVKAHYETQIQKLTDKYEKRLQGLEKKYVIDTEGLKKQIAQLHKKLGEHSCVR